MEIRQTRGVVLRTTGLGTESVTQKRVEFIRVGRVVVCDCMETAQQIHSP